MGSTCCSARKDHVFTTLISLRLESEVVQRIYLGLHRRKLDRLYRVGCIKGEGYGASSIAAQRRCCCCVCQGLSAIRPCPDLRIKPWRQPDLCVRVSVGISFSPANRRAESR